MLLIGAGTASAGTLTGVVRNGTTGQPAAGVTVVLIHLQGGMDEAGSTKTDAQGRYQFDRPEIGQQPLLVRVNYRGVNYHQNVPPGRPTADVEIFEPGATERDLQVRRRVIVFHPNGNSLLVGEQYDMENTSRPPLSYAKEFAFAIPESAEFGEAFAWGASGMAVSQGIIRKGGGQYSIAFPLRPGPSGTRFSYTMSYAGSQATVRVSSPLGAERVEALVPGTVQMSAAGFALRGSEQGYQVFVRELVPAGAALEFAVSGVAPPPDAAPSGGKAAAEGAAAAPAAQVIPPRLDQLQWVLVAGFAALFFLGGVFLWLRPAPSANGASAGPAAGPAAQIRAAAAQVHAEVHRGMDEMKDILFRLELRRQAGTISEEEYTRERGRVEQTLRELVRG
jgi:hypothetical protein